MTDKKINIQEKKPEIPKDFLISLYLLMMVTGIMGAILQQPLVGILIGIGFDGILYIYAIYRGLRPSNDPINTAQELAIGIKKGLNKVMEYRDMTITSGDLENLVPRAIEFLHESVKLVNLADSIIKEKKED